MSRFTEYAFRILRDNGAPMHLRKLTEIAMQQGLETQGSTPWNTMRVKLKGDSRFVNAPPGHFGLAPGAAELPPDSLVGVRGAPAIDPAIRKHRQATEPKNENVVAQRAETIADYGQTGRMAADLREKGGAGLLADDDNDLDETEARFAAAMASLAADLADEYAAGLLEFPPHLDATGGVVTALRDGSAVEYPMVDLRGLPAGSLNRVVNLTNHMIAKEIETMQEKEDDIRTDELRRVKNVARATRLSVKQVIEQRIAGLDFDAIAAAAEPERADAGDAGRLEAELRRGICRISYLSPDKSGQLMLEGTLMRSMVPGGESLEQAKQGQPEGALTVFSTAADDFVHIPLADILLLEPVDRIGEEA